MGGGVGVVSLCAFLCFPSFLLGKHITLSAGKKIYFKNKHVRAKFSTL